MISKIRKELCKVLVKTPLWSTKRYFLIILLSTISTLKSIFRKVFWAAVTFLMVFVRGIPPHILCNTVIFPWTQKGCDWLMSNAFHILVILCRIFEWWDRDLSMQLSIHVRFWGKIEISNVIFCEQRLQNYPTMNVGI